MMFEFDPAKSAVNTDKHGIDFEQAKVIWDDGKALRIEAHDGPDGEPRWLVIGRIGDRIWSAATTDRGEATRIISVRRARKDEEDLYDQQKF